MSFLSRNKVDYAKYKKAWVSKSYLVNRLNSFWIPKYSIHYVNIDSIRNYVKLRKRIIEISNLGGARDNMKLDLRK